MKKKIIKIYLYTLVIGGLYAVWLMYTEMFIPCGFYSATGYLCPGCGISRMFLAMLRLDFKTAFGYNSLMFILFFIWNGIALGCFIGKPKVFQNKSFLYWGLGITVGLFFIFTILRNIY